MYSHLIGFIQSVCVYIYIIFWIQSEIAFITFASP